jgi:release factor glutamine methyltransferase
MRLSDFMQQATSQLDQAGIATGRLDVLVLIEDRLGVDRAQLLGHPELELSLADKNVLNKQIGRRAKQVPLAYVRGKTEFYGREFIITPAVLEPRPETETMIDLFKQVLQAAELTRFPVSTVGNLDKNETSTRLRHKLLLDRSDKDKSGQSYPRKYVRNQLIRVADVGSGSGAIGTTAKLEIPEISIDLLEIDDKAIEISKMNVDKHTAEISVLKSNLLAHSPQDYDILLCNLPYVPDSFHINTAANHEPKLAIFGGPDGLDIYRKLFDQIKIVAKKPLYIITENLPFQHTEAERIAIAAGYRLVLTDDFIQAFQGSS